MDPDIRKKMIKLNYFAIVIIKQFNNCKTILEIFC